MTLTDFLLARIAEDEQHARRLLKDLVSQIEDGGATTDDLGPITPQRMLAADLAAKYRGQSRWDNVARGQYITAIADPARVLAECEAKRRIVGLYAPGWPLYEEQWSSYAGDTLRFLALPYTDHPDYDESWRS